MVRSGTAIQEVLLHDGWLSRLPNQFQADVLELGRLQTFAPSEAVYRIGDRGGGVYGLVSGTLSISLAPSHAAPRFVLFGIVGAWAGEGPFFTGEPRRAEMRAVTSCQLFHLSLEAMERLTTLDPRAARYFAQMTIAHFDVLARIIDDLLIPKASQRIASVLHRAGWLQARVVPISQTDLGAMANASRKQVNAALAHFSAQKWVTVGYRRIEIVDPSALLRFASGI